MKTKGFFAIVIIMALIALAMPAVAKDNKDGDKATVVMTVSPAMHCRNCEAKIKSNLRFEKGVSEITTNVKDNTVTVVYDTRKTNPEKIAMALGKIGYKAQESGKE